MTRRPAPGKRTRERIVKGSVRSMCIGLVGACRHRRSGGPRPPLRSTCRSSSLPGPRWVSWLRSRASPGAADLLAGSRGCRSRTPRTACRPARRGWWISRRGAFPRRRSLAARGLRRDRGPGASAPRPARATGRAPSSPRGGCSIHLATQSGGRLTACARPGRRRGDPRGSRRILPGRAPDGVSAPPDGGAAREIDEERESRPARSFRRGPLESSPRASEDVRGALLGAGRRPGAGAAFEGHDALPGRRPWRSARGRRARPPG